MSFVPQDHLQKYGWESGSGLGKEEQGIKSAIKVKLKFDTTGVGHDPGEQFTNNWWDEAFNSAANSIKITEHENGVNIKKTGECHISTKKINKSLITKSMLYGSFVKAATLTDGAEINENKTDSSDSESDAELSQNGQLSDEQLFKICGGRTAHKGARHGLKLNGKLARLAEQEALMVTSNPKKSSSEVCNNTEVKKCKKKNKLKKKKRRVEEVTTKDQSIETLSKSKKSLKRKKDDEVKCFNGKTTDLKNSVDFNNLNVMPKKKKKTKNRNKIDKNTKHDD